MSLWLALLLQENHIGYGCDPSGTDRAKQKEVEMRKLFLTSALIVASLGAVAVTPEKAQARPPWSRYASYYGGPYYSYYYGAPYSYGSPYTSNYYGTPYSTSYYYAPGAYYTAPYYSSYYTPSYYYTQPSYYWGTAPTGMYYGTLSPNGYYYGSYSSPTYNYMWP
jgi:hypothetical protein